MPRLFAGLELPEEAVDTLADIEQPLPGARWIALDDLHITLRFYGDVEKAVARDIVEHLAHIDLPMFMLALSGLGVFGPREPQTLWAGVQPSQSLMDLQAATEKAGRMAGLKPETRNFKPHVTLARLKRPPERGLARLLSRWGALRTEPFPVGRFVLYSAKPNTGGGPYVIEEKFGLQGGSWDDEEEDVYGPETYNFSGRGSF